MLIPLLTEYEKENIAERQALPERYLGLSDEEMDRRIAAAKATLGRRLVILGHHYQRDEVIKFADYIGDSYKLAGQVSKHPDAEFIVFCGVHFMAESADVLSAAHQQVILPDLAAGCSMADMAAPDQLEQCWADLEQMLERNTTIIPVTYINSAASIKAFCGEHGGVVCTSSNAAATLKWAWERGECPARSDGRVGSERDLGRPRARPREERAHHPVEGTLLRARALHRAANREHARAASGRPRDRAPRGAVGRRAGRGRRRLD
jgi:hypothetical protein